MAEKFVAKFVEGLPEVTEVAVFPNRLELSSAGKSVVIRFLDIARWHRCAWLWRPLAHLGWLGGCPCVADRHWFPYPWTGYFALYTNPRLVVYMPEEPIDLNDSERMFRRVQHVIAAGGFNTFDLG